MPDHAHFLVRGLTEHAHLPPVVRRAKQSTGIRFSRRWSGRLWQEGYYERVLRSDESVENVARYIEANPVRAGLAKTVGEWPFTGGAFLRRMDGGAKGGGETELEEMTAVHGESEYE